jgi:hypothetical protein
MGSLSRTDATPVELSLSDLLGDLMDRFRDNEFSCLTCISVSYAFLRAKACQEASLSGLDSESDNMMGCKSSCFESAGQD